MIVRKLLTLIIIAFIAENLFALTINESGGWLESAFVKWAPIDSAKSYNVYYTGEGIINKKIDNQLIRNYGSYYRADILGLKAGSYTIKVTPVYANGEGTGSETNSVTVYAHDRTGFAFSNGRVPGAYKADGTPKDDAVILYITENTKNKVSLSVNQANLNPCVGLQTILDGFKKGKDNRALIIRLIGQVTDFAYDLGGDIVIENDNNTSSYITFEGVGDDAVADGWGIRVKNATNIEIRNIGTMNCNSKEGDNIGLQQSNSYIWVHHCDFFYGDAGGDADQAKGDGALDSKTSGYVTISYNHFWDSGKSNLLGNGTEDPEYLTYHHNWYDHSDSRHPRVRSHSVHVYNNYYDGNSKYGVGSTNASSVFVEGNYFRNCKYPMLTSMQGTDIFYGSPTFSSEDGGTIKAYNNYLTGYNRFVAYGDTLYPNPKVEFDAVVVDNRNDLIGDSITSKKGTKTYNNFDTNTSVMYNYTPDSPDDARIKVMEFAGRINGGDFKWIFDNSVDDESYLVNTELKAALTSYKTSLVSIQGDSIATGGETDTTTTGGGTGGDPTAGDYVHNFTESGLSSSFYSITGSLSDSKGIVEYSELTLDICLKMESSTIVSFSTNEDAIYTLVFNTGFSGNIKLNDTLYSVSNGILSIPIVAGSYELKKDDVANLYYMSIDYLTNGFNVNEMSAPVVYPNPVINNLNILSGSDIVKVDIYTISGSLIKSLSGNLKTLDMSNLSKGSYLFVLHTINGISKQIVIKE
ncbi:MAG: T9SS type A sorting domain-containing protein [Marinilabiliaceae bacterium]|nr:T9SS type A sorting domain-containing protein [Marinilabiliaceae bacterium]